MGNGITAKLDNLSPMTLDAPVAHSSKRHKLSLTREATLLTFAVLAYFGVRYITQGTTDAAIANANRLLHLESLFALGFEAAVQSWALARSSIAAAANAIYMWLHWPVIIGAMIIAYKKWPHAFLRLRNAMIISGLVGLVIFAAFPVAPPRLLADGVFVDTITNNASTYRSLQPPSLVNEYAAVPSFHVGWNILLVMALRPYLPKVLRTLAWFSPILMTAAVVITANHYIVDAVIGAVVVLGAWVIAGFITPPIEVDTAIAEDPELVTAVASSGHSVPKSLLASTDGAAVHGTVTRRA